jgi:serine protease Do
VEFEVFPPGDSLPICNFRESCPSFGRGSFISVKRNSHKQLISKQQMKIRLPKAIAALALGGAVLAAGVCVVSTVRASDETHSKAKNLGLVVDNSALDRDLKGVNASYSAIVKKVSPSVVTINSTIVSKGGVNMPNLPDDPFFRFFGPGFRNFNRPQKEHGVGSGVIVSKDGYILTNNHVVDDAEKVQVKMQDGRNYVAKVIGKDPKSDLAVVRIDASDLPAITIADSDKCEVGDVVLALGNPFNVGPSVTMGIISATGRTSLGVEDYEDFIQTDAAINPGNSGGALIDTQGRLIGINTAIVSRSGGNQGIGLAIPSDLAREVMLSLVEYGKVSRGYLGVMIQPLTPELAREFKVKTEHGALVGDVVPDGPAEKAGLKSGDVIVQFNNKPVADSARLRLEVSRMAPGQKVPLVVERDGASKTFEVKLKALPGEKEVAQNDQGRNDTDTLQGVGVEDISAQARQQYNVPDNIKGALVTEVDPNSAAYEGGVRVGDVIMEINHHPVRNSEDAVQLTQHARERVTLLHLWSSGGSHYVVVDESKAG